MVHHDPLVVLIKLECRWYSQRLIELRHRQWAVHQALDKMCENVWGEIINLEIVENGDWETKTFGEEFRLGLRDDYKIAESD